MALTIDEKPAVSDLLRAFRNDYEDVRLSYVSYTGKGLLSDPFAHPNTAPPLPSDLTLSVVIPCRNAAATIGSCLNALALTDFARLRPDNLDVLVVDDGSEDDTSGVAASSSPSLSLTILRQNPGGRAQAMNLGLAFARGQVVVSCDSDMILTRTALSELAVRHVVADNVLCIGFRADVADRIEDLPSLSQSRGTFFLDNRWRFDQPGWPENMLRTVRMLGNSAGDLRLPMPAGQSPYPEVWSLPRMVYGTMFSVSRSLIDAIGGFDERFVGWGWEDTWFAARCIAASHRIIPVPSAFGFHVAHSVRSPRHWEEAAANKARFEALLASRFDFAPLTQFSRARSRLKKYVFRVRSTQTPTEDPKLPPPLRCDRLNSLSALGLIDDVIGVLSQADRLSSADLCIGLRSAWQANRLAVAGDLIEKALSKREVWNADLLRERTWFALASGNLEDAKQLLKRWNEVGRVTDPHLAYINRTAPEIHFQRGEVYESQGLWEPAWRDFAASALCSLTSLHATDRYLNCLEAWQTSTNRTSA